MPVPMFRMPLERELIAGRKHLTMIPGVAGDTLLGGLSAKTEGGPAPVSAAAAMIEHPQPVARPIQRWTMPGIGMIAGSQLTACSRTTRAPNEPDVLSLSATIAPRLSLG